MRWFSHRARTWKDTVLKIKIKKKAKGFTLVATALAVLCWIFIAQAFFMMSSGTLSTVKAERTAYQAEQNTALDVSRLKALDYDDLDSKGAHARKVIEGVGDGNWESEVTIDPEQPLNGGDDDAKLRIAHVKVYRTGDTTSRYSLDVPLTSQGSGDIKWKILGKEGYIKIPNGPIIQFGQTDIVPASRTICWSFPIEFPHAVLSIAGGVDYRGSRGSNGEIEIVDNASFCSFHDEHDGPINYIAVGY